MVYIPNELNIGKTRSRTINNKIEQLVQDERTVLTNVPFLDGDIIDQIGHIVSDT